MRIFQSLVKNKIPEGISKILMLFFTDEFNFFNRIIRGHLCRSKIISDFRWPPYLALGFIKYLLNTVIIS